MVESRSETRPPALRSVKLRFWLTVAWSAAVLLAALALAPLVGPHKINLLEALTGASPVDARILLVARLPRVLMAGLAGAVLAAAGMAFQALLRNPLAEPFTLGVSSGASMGAVLSILLGLDLSFAGFGAVPLFALAGALAAVGIVYMLARASSVGAGRYGTGAPELSTGTLLLAGVCLAFSFHSVILLAHYLADFGNSYRMLRWLMGGLGVTDFRTVLQVLPFAVTGLALLAAVTRDLNVLAGGWHVARSRGVDVRMTQKIAYFAASLTTASVVAVVGPIGFVGLMVPHVMRMLVGPDHRILLPACCGVGGAFLILCDTVARTVLAPAELPVGVLTAMMGGPFMIWLLIRQKRKNLPMS